MNVKRNWAVARVAFNTATDTDLDIVDKEDDEALEVKENDEVAEEKRYCTQLAICYF